MNVTVDLVNASGDSAVPASEDFRYWTNAAMTCLHPERKSCELSIRLMDEAESASLNETWRGKQGSTNILSFPFSAHVPDTEAMLGDLAICVPVVKLEARQQNKNAKAHWAHLTVHGVLHLNGYDHENADDAAVMEKLEVKILTRLGFDNPYA
ncbi:MAG: rRNA maturation RNase YbeY [Pseudohongiellaceae bacterium]